MFFKKLIWTFKRHPFLYLTRFKLLSKNIGVSDIVNYSYNQLNSKDEIPDYFHKINELVFLGGRPQKDIEIVKKLSLWLVENIEGGSGLSMPSEKALKIMLAGEGGVCSDMAQVFNNFCVINDLQVREWGSTRAPFNKDYGGHSFNEVFCKELDKWVLIDVSYCVMFYDNSGVPMSVIELFQFLSSNQKVNFSTFRQSNMFTESGVAKNYLSTDAIPFLICNYSNKIYDSYLNIYRPYFPVFLIHFILYLSSKSYYYCFPLGDYKKIFS